MYVLECGDGSLYTGYATDVAARVAAHAAGKGARYTKAHPPVRLVAQARFFSKQRAMSAEARFKRLSRAEKDQLLRLAASEPLEDVLCRELPGFGDDSAQEFVCRSLARHAEEGFARFQASLIPNVDAWTIVGVRTSELRRIARELVRRDDADGFLGAPPHRFFEEMQVHAFAIGLERDYDVALRRCEAFLPYVDNWATCDQLPIKALAERPEETLVKVGEWLSTNRCYIMRFAIRVLMVHYLGERFEPRYLDMVAAAHLTGGRGEPRLGRRHLLPQHDARLVLCRGTRVAAGARSSVPRASRHWRPARRVDPPQGDPEGHREPPDPGIHEGPAARLQVRRSSSSVASQCRRRSGGGVGAGVRRRQKPLIICSLHYSNVSRICILELWNP